MAVETNLEIIRRTRKRPSAGDIFAMRMRGKGYLFGRVAYTKLPGGGWPLGWILVYIYRDLALEKTLNLTNLTPDRLLLPPVFSHRVLWTDGYFETIENRPIQREDLLEQHCFRKWNGEYIDEHMRKLPGPIEPCGDFGLPSIRALDNEISDGLGIPRAIQEPD